MAKPRPPEALFPDNPQVTKVFQDVYDKLTDDTKYDDTEVLTKLAMVTEEKLQAATYTERKDDIHIEVSGAWTDVDLSPYGVQEGDVVDVHAFSSGPYNTLGLRTDGSSIDRSFTMADDESVTLSAVAGERGFVELYVNDYTEFLQTFLVGYWHFSTS